MCIHQDLSVATLASLGNQVKPSCPLCGQGTFEDILLWAIQVDCRQGVYFSAVLIVLKVWCVHMFCVVLGGHPHPAAMGAVLILGGPGKELRRSLYVVLFADRDEASNHFGLQHLRTYHLP